MREIHDLRIEYRFSKSKFYHRVLIHLVRRFCQSNRETEEFFSLGYVQCLTCSIGIREQLSAQSHIGPQLSAARFLR